MLSDPAQRLRSAERVRQLLTAHLGRFGLRRGKSSWWYRLRPGRAELVHVALRRGHPAFRIQGAIRVLEDPSPVIDLNGPAWNIHDAEHLEFSDSSPSIKECASECAAYVERTLVPWFDQWTEAALLQDPHAPFTVDQRDAFLDSLGGRGDSVRQERSLRLFGATPEPRRLARKPRGL